jgi:gentisate 1,2-dioxygenase
MPLVNLFEASFAEHFTGEVQPHTVPEGDSLARYGANMLPVDFQSTRLSSPIFNYCGMASCTPTAMRPSE